MSDLLKQAIADIDRLNEMALENAKLFLAESTQADVSKEVLKKLDEAVADTEEVVEEVSNETVEEGVNPGSSGIGTGDNVQPSSDSNSTSTIGTTSEPTFVKFGEGEETPDGEKLSESTLDDDIASLEEEFADLEAVLRELETVEEGVASEAESVTTEEVTTEARGDKKDEDKDEDKDEKKDKKSKEKETDDDSEDDDDIDIEKLMKEADAEIAAESLANTLEALKEENASLKESIQEHRKVIQYFRGKLSGLNLTNAKLLYTGRLFKGHNGLTTEQKDNVVKTFERAHTIREVKLAYSILAESLKKPINRVAKNIAEGLSSAPVGGEIVHHTLVEEAKAEADGEKFPMSPLMRKLIFGKRTK